MLAQAWWFSPEAKGRSTQHEPMLEDPGPRSAWRSIVSNPTKQQRAGAGEQRPVGRGTTPAAAAAACRRKAPRPIVSSTQPDDVHVKCTGLQIRRL